ncbi:GNAT family N-acetyltransferase [Shimia abyssi]|uniref:N-acetylglutamate synthase-like GNAT family acetyltransferase n=1 Tax=Shimia abyssi TaxID=1662395 RepID=A0A2P8F9I5_9RHOB|nr:GNAT family N-acetyltransferase [Shimia abyssi]PSL18384.1 N-acetylglutamate synthase-like GNAT family acetyltransferase [Shimia abyssi]
MLEIREAKRIDLGAILALYTHLSPTNVPIETTRAEEIFDAFGAYRGSAILVGELDGECVASCAVVIIPNLTRLGRPYALIENVVTHSDYRGCGHGTRILDAACARAWDAGCYKVMLMTGSTEASTLAFYQRAGFQQTKTGFQKRHVVEKP